MKNSVTLFLLLCFLSSCGIPKEEYDELRQENMLLKAKLDSIKPLLAKIPIEVTLNGKYSCKDCIYDSFSFNKKRVTMTAMGGLATYTMKYEQEGPTIYIPTDKGELVLQVVNENTLQGEGFAAGIYKKH